MRKKRNVSPELAALRARVGLDHDNAISKKSRNRARGIELNGTAWDPVRPRSVINSYNRSQLLAYQRTLRAFNSPESQFMFTHQGIAGPDIAVPFMKAERALNAQRRKAFKEIKDVKLPGSSETLGESMGLTEPKHRRMADPATDNPFKETNRRGVRFANPKAIRDLTEKMRKEATPEHRATIRNRNRSTLEKMFTKLNMPMAAKAIGDLGDKAFDVLFYDPKFMNQLGLQYSMTTANMSDDQKPFVDDLMRGAETEIMELAEKAAVLDGPAGELNKRLAKESRTISQLGNLSAVQMETSNRRGRGRPRKGQEAWRFMHPIQGPKGGENA